MFFGVGVRVSNSMQYVVLSVKQITTLNFIGSAN